MQNTKVRRERGKWPAWRKKLGVREKNLKGERKKGGKIHWKMNLKWEGGGGMIKMHNIYPRKYQNVIFPDI